KKIKADYLHPHYITVTKSFVKNLHKNGIKVNVWTVNKPDIATKLLKYGVDGLITDLPAMANELVEKYEI
ncbi:MAG: glycerophosphodiester phosphodiesterase, partial [Clostridia bacterium]|nr:glycerophosphodiester phosphodiesterase [Clostridia bacterium]